ncbi:protein kinase family protein [Hamadaea tsunoensis]|uniref:protein kinase family protein n=1 Tax=Hamadaea tsunoensis TaxID=53368 RepID=UPI0003FB9BD1|nr:protein kinase family protein [Hamadaea tsunoensis]
MTHVGEGQPVAEKEHRTADRPSLGDVTGPDPGSAPSASPTDRAGTVGEVLADRYRLEEHINDDAGGRQVWRGVDIMLLRPIAVVLRAPGGPAAEEMLAAAVTASRVVHPHLIGVYDAIDEGHRAYVVREWVEGVSLRQIVEGEGPLDPDRAVNVVHAIAEAVSALHASGMAHGNVHPGTVLLGDDGRVVLTDARAGSATNDGDVRSIGGILYYALTEQWPRKEAGALGLPDGVRDENGVLATPRQVRAGVPTHLDDLVGDLLNERVTLPSADVLAAELDRLDVAGEERGYGPLRFSETLPEPPRQRSRRLIYGVAAVVVLALVGLTISARALTSNNQPGDKGGNTVSAQPSTSAPSVAEPVALTLSGGQVNLFDPQGDGTQKANLDKAVDGKNTTGWKSEHYNQNFGPGGLKAGMGIWLDLGTPQSIADVQVVLSGKPVSAKLLGGATVPDSSALTTYKQIGNAFDDFNGTNMVFSQSDDGAEKVRYLLLWITSMPRDTADSAQRFQIGVQEITVRVA